MENGERLGCAVVVPDGPEPEYEYETLVQVVRPGGNPHSVEVTLRVPADRPPSVRIVVSRRRGPGDWQERSRVELDSTRELGPVAQALVAALDRVRAHERRRAVTAYR